MPKRKPALWGCPLCYVSGVQGRQVPYGTSCPNREACDEPLNINGEWFARQETLKSEKTIGIAEIANENEESE
jgi:hypothetical protein